MKVLYVYLNFTFFFESFSIYPKRYGAGAIFARWLKESEDFSILAHPECFADLTRDESREGCLNLGKTHQERLLNGEPLDEVAFLDPTYFDLVVHAHTDIFLNLDGMTAKQAVWTPGLNEKVHPNHKHLIYFGDYQFPILPNPNIRKHRFTLGRVIDPIFQPTNKEDFIFTCSRHVPDFCSIELAQFCLSNKIKGIFAGPIQPGYDLLKYIDGKTTFYLGEVSEEVKMHYTRRAARRV